MNVASRGHLCTRSLRRSAWPQSGECAISDFMSIFLHLPMKQPSSRPRPVKAGFPRTTLAYEFGRAQSRTAQDLFRVHIVQPTGSNSKFHQRRNQGRAHRRHSKKSCRKRVEGCEGAIKPRFDVMRLSSPAWRCLGRSTTDGTFSVSGALLPHTAWVGRQPINTVGVSRRNLSSFWFPRATIVRGTWRRPASVKLLAPHGRSDGRILRQGEGKGWLQSSTGVKKFIIHEGKWQREL